MVGIIFYSLIQFRKSNKGFISLSDSLKIGMGTSLVSALIGIIYTQILINFIDPDTLTKSLELSMETIRFKIQKCLKKHLKLHVLFKKKCLAL